MAVFLDEYIDNLTGLVNPPGTDLFPNATNNDWLIRLQNGFWTAFIDGAISGYTEEFGEVSNTTPGGAELGREYIQLILLYSAIDTVGKHILNLRTNERYVAGPVEAEFSRSATALNAILADLINQRDRLLERLAPTVSTSTYYYNLFEERSGSCDPYINGGYV